MIILIALGVGGCWTLRNMSKDDGLSKDEEGIMKRYLEVMAMKKDKAGGADAEGKEESKDDEDENNEIDSRRSYADSIAEIYSPRWARSDATSPGSPEALKKGPFMPYVAGADGMNPFIPNLATRHMSIQMTTLNRRESTRLDPEVAGAEEPGAPPVREYSFNPMNASNNKRVSTTVTRTGALTAEPRRASAAVVSSQFHAGPDATAAGQAFDSSAAVPFSRRASAGVGGGALNMSMQLAGRSGALALGGPRRLSAIPTGSGAVNNSNNYDDEGETSPAGRGEEPSLLLEVPVPPTPPVRKSVFQKEVKGPSRFTLK